MEQKILQYLNSFSGVYFTPPPPPSGAIFTLSRVKHLMWNSFNSDFRVKYTQFFLLPKTPTVELKLLLRINSVVMGLSHISSTE